MKSIRLGFCILVLGSFNLVAQNPVLFTRPSQMAKVFQRIGTTDIEVVYHAPLAKDREIFGGIVPYDEKINGKDHPWRAGANENTTISFSHDVEINGQMLPAGTYGFHIFVSEDEWTLTFSNRYQDWGSFSYTADEDALRVKVKPQNIPMQDLLSYSFADAKPDMVTLNLRWETTQVSFDISTNVDKNILADLEKIEDKNATHLYVAASVLLKSDSSKTEEAMQLVNESIELKQNLSNSLLKADLLRMSGDKKAAKKLTEEALASATGNELFSYAMKLNNEDEPKESMRILKLNLKQNPDDWFTQLGFANYYMTKDEYAKAIPYFEEALRLAPDRAKGFANYRLGFAKSKLAQ
ncbi:DUF2911 domain-containing protein [Ekhidna sp. To15]|uniref:DUF2911 domain-containing protein n=1 Tax=Ekhidna sp. To15 TaxID=3395267 RepID=UPI003F524159